MPGGGRGSLDQMADIYIQVAKDGDICNELKKEIINCLTGIVKVALENGYHLDNYEDV